MVTHSQLYRRSSFRRAQCGPTCSWATDCSALTGSAGRRGWHSNLSTATCVPRHSLFDTQFDEGQSSQPATQASMVPTTIRTARVRVEDGLAQLRGNLVSALCRGLAAHSVRSPPHIFAARLEVEALPTVAARVSRAATWLANLPPPVLARRLVSCSSGAGVSRLRRPHDSGLASGMQKYRALHEANKGNQAWKRTRGIGGFGCCNVRTVWKAKTSTQSATCWMLSTSLTDTVTGKSLQHIQRTYQTLAGLQRQ